MAEEIVVKGASVSLTPASTAAGITLNMGTPVTHTLSKAGSGPFTTSESNEILLESDIDLSFIGFSTSYSKGTYVGGGLVYQSLASVSNLSELTTKNGEPVVLKKTTGTITCMASPQANDPNAGPDAAVSYDLDFSFTDASQTLAKSD
jgi:hypothetical protein